MDRRVFHGNIAPTDVARALMAEFNQGNTQTQLLGESGNLTVQIASSQYSRSGGRTAVSVNLQQIEDGVMVQVGEQQWLGVAASLGQTAISALLNPFNLLGRLDDIAQDVTSLQLNEKIWQIVANVVRTAGASQELSERLSSVTCEFCGAANPVGASTCEACGAPLGKAQPKTCPKCGYVLTHDEKFCPNCGQAATS
ncbi:MAG: zinc ribbon domain-containing protein [Candidatus Atribacteria bacterium]|nr:zinc ribbon domain-containing protein [Candidatus Atribacteria bacterium]